MESPKLIGKIIIMEKVKSSQKDKDKADLMGLFCAGVGLILYFTLKEGFAITAAIAGSITILITLISAYPIFLRGTKNRWTKNKREWAFSQLLIVSVISSILMFTLLRIIETLIIFYSIKSDPF